jgi:hypothetical protein
MMQNHPPGAFLGKRVRLTARVKTEKVHWAQIWMRVDPKDRFVNNKPALSFYNMDDRPIRGTTGWTRYEVVLDVPDGAVNVAWGFTLAGGEGTVWADGFTLEEVGRDVPVSVMPRRRAEYY